MSGVSKLLPVALLVAAVGCNCGEAASKVTLTPFDDARFTPDGRALLLEAADGLYLAEPPTSEPRLLSNAHCGADASRTLGCLRLAPDGQRFAVLYAGRDRGHVRVWDAVVASLGGGAVAPEVAAPKEVVDAQFTPDGGDLVLVRMGPVPKTVALFRNGPVAETLLVPAVELETEDLFDAARAVVLTRDGLAYPRVVNGTVEVWFKSWDEAALDTGGRLSDTCAGTYFGDCVSVSPDGAALAWREPDSGVVHLFQTRRRIDLPLGRGHGFAFSRAGRLALRLGKGPSAAFVHDVETAAVVRSAVGAVSGELAFDGETLAHLEIVSSIEKVARLFVGPARQRERDNDLGTFKAGPVPLLAEPAAGDFELEHAFTGDGRFVVVGVEGPTPDTSSLTAIDAATGERRTLASLACTRCCTIAPAGAAIACLPGGFALGAPAKVELYDPVTGTRTEASESAVDLQFLFDGSGVALLELRGGAVPELTIVTKDGRRTGFGQVRRYALAPNAPQLAVLSPFGALRVLDLP